jgi:hypothetical protein
VINSKKSSARMLSALSSPPSRRSIATNSAGAETAEYRAGADDGGHPPHWRVGGAAVMNEHSLLAEDQKFVAPIRCSECDDNARLIRRMPYPFEGLEIRTFECLACRHQIKRIVASEEHPT